MIKFFRTIRKSLFMENKTSKPTLPAGRYFKYALGEIFLVVLGILIALQINNWNEHRKDQQKEQHYLKNLKDDLIGIKSAYSIANKVETIVLKQSQDILTHYEANNGFYNMDTIFPKINDLTVRWGVTANSTTLNEMINSGQTKLISNPDLKKDLIAFNEELKLWSTNTMNNNTNLVDNLILPEIAKLGNFSAGSYSDEMIVIFESYTFTKIIKVNDDSLASISIENLNIAENKLKIINLINYRHNIASLQKGVNTFTIKRVEQLLKAIETELHND